MNVNDPTGNMEISDGYGTISGAAAVDYSGPLDEFVRFKNSSGEWVTQRISGDGATLQISSIRYMAGFRNRMRL